jgi:hypothetical protein
MCEINPIRRVGEIANPFGRAMEGPYEARNTTSGYDGQPRSAVTKLSMPVLTIEGDKSMGGALEAQAKIGVDRPFQSY